jgi:tetratricopeptide (TPR) repeat protein
MNTQKFGTLLLLLIFGISSQGYSQCTTWNESDRKSEAEDAHVVYRGNIKEKKFDEAFPYWEKAYTIAPAADGQRSFHFSDGVDIYMHKFQNETDEAKKKEYAQRILELYDQWVQCYPKEAGYARGRQAYNMFYTLRSDYGKLAEVLAEGLEKGGMNSEYIILDPYAHVVVWMYENEMMTDVEARKVHASLVELADHNIANNKNYGSYYQQAKDAMLGTFDKIEREIFDCEYFKNKFLPQYKADPDNKEVYREVYKQLVKGGCDKSDPIVYEIFLKDSIATMEDFKVNNPGFFANELYKQGKFEEAIAKYEEAIAKEDDPEKLADYHLAIASIQFRKLNRYSSARSSALNAAKLKPNWGQPYLLIGDMYAQSSNSCGSNQVEKGLAVLAALDKYAYARSIDDTPEVQSDASSKIARYSAYKPDKGEAFMMKIKEGQSMQVPCWIGETVKVRFK